MSGALSLIGYCAALLATGVFWLGVEQETFLLRVAGAVIATFGIWIGDSAARAARARATSPAATLNGVLLLVMALISLFLHFTD